MLLPVAALLVNAFVWGVSWWPFRQLDALGLHSLWATSLVYLASAAAIAAVRPGALPQLLRRPALWGLLVASGLTNSAFNWGVLVGDVVRVVLLFYLMPVWAALLARWLLREPLTAAGAARAALALAGAALVLWQPGAGLPLPAALGDWLGLAGGMSFALVNVLLRRHASEPPEARAMAMFAGGMLVPGALAAVLAAGGAIAFPPAPSFAWLAGTALLACAFLGGNLALQYGAARLPANVTAVVMLSEVVFATATAVWLGGETLGLRSMIGAALILGATALAAVAPPPPHPPGDTR